MHKSLAIEIGDILELARFIGNKSFVGMTIKDV